MKFPHSAKNVESLLVQSDLLRNQGRIEEALTALDIFLRDRPSDAVAHCKRGLVLKQMRRWNEALACFEQGVTLEPRLAPAHMDRGNVLQEMGRLIEALESYNHALALQPHYVAALCNRGTVLHRLHRLDEAIASYDAALALEPGLEEARFNRSTALSDAGRYSEALQGFQDTLTRLPELAVAHWNEAICRLRMGDFQRGFAKFEWRWKYADLRLRRRAYPQPLWLGQADITGRTVLLYAEQGLGDTIQFSRYALELVRRGASVVLESPLPLAALMESLRQNAGGRLEVIAEGNPLPAFDFHAPLMSMPLAFNTSVDTIPAPIPYVHAHPDRVTHWAHRLSQEATLGALSPCKKPRIGIAWSGNPQHTNYYNRSISLGEMHELAALDVEWIALQNDIRASDQEFLSQMRVRYFGPELHDFSETAALAANMDVVVSVDSAPAHLAGAMGLPLAVLLPHSPDWRWLLQRDDSPWYPSARLFRQSAPGDWKAALVQLREYLRRLVTARPAP